MTKIKSIILDQTNWLEITWVDEVETVIHCESFGDSDEYHELIRQRLVELNAETTQELENILEEQVSKRHIPTEEEIAEELRKQEEYRVQSIKLTAQSLILNKYSLEKQSSAQLGLYGDEYLEEMKTFISSIIEISNKAEKEGTKLEDIKWQQT